MNEISAIDAWNFRLLKTMENELRPRMTRNGMMPVKSTHDKIDKALEFLEDFEQVKQQTIIDRLVKIASLIDKEIAELKQPKWYQFKKMREFRERAIILTTVRHAYTDTVETIMTTLPTGFTLDELGPVPTIEQETESPKTIPIDRNGAEGIQSSQSRQPEP